jgi:pimeloyl-ACP methyl ester carboxylesterase
MAVANLRGINITYEIIGEHGPWVALSPGGRRGLDGVRDLAERMARSGYRMVIFDRRNCGATDVVIEGEESEFSIWTDDLYALLTELNALPAFIGGGSSGCRLSFTFALRYPDAVLGLLLWRVTGGALSCEILAENYYGQFAAAAETGGMEAVCATEYFAECIAANPSNRGRLLAMKPETFIAAMNHWAGYFLADKDLPVIGATEDDLKSIAVPTCVVPGNDRQHSRVLGQEVSRLIPNAELHDLMKEDLDVDLGPIEDWNAVFDEMADTFTDFLGRNLPPAGGE